MPDAPILIVTRPAGQAAGFAKRIARDWGGPLQIILSPLIEIVPLPVDVDADLDGLEAVIFTSTNGVAQAARLPLRDGLPAYCVGDRTAQAAAAAGFSPLSGPGDAAGLRAMIIADRPRGMLAHIRGRHARGEIAQTLTQAGYRCLDLPAYDQRALALTRAALDALAGPAPVIVPLFSPRTAALFSTAANVRAPLHLVAISPSAVPDVTGAESCSIASRPDIDAMADATLRCLQAV